MIELPEIEAPEIPDELAPPNGDPDVDDPYDDPYPDVIIPPDDRSIVRAHSAAAHGLFDYGESWA